MDDETVHVTGNKRKRQSGGKGLRTRTGCSACRARRVKCDERRPACRACTKRSDDCVYPVESAEREQSATNDDEPSEQSTVNITSNTSNASKHGTPRQHESQPNSGQAQHFASSSTQPAISLTDQRLEDYFPQLSSFQDIWDNSPDSTRTTAPIISAEEASLLWFNLLANDSSGSQVDLLAWLDGPETSAPQADGNRIAPIQPTSGRIVSAAQSPRPFVSREDTPLSKEEVALFRHFVVNLSSWIDITDPDRSFAIKVSHLALSNLGLMTAILALSSRHLAIGPAPSPASSSGTLDSAQAVQYYNDTLHYLQHAMRDVEYLRSDELLATVLIISTYEMIDGSGRDWERHLKGVFYIQRSQLIHGESVGLKKCIWWAWLRQDIWAAFKDRRKILSFYSLTRPCAELDFWELANRGFYLLGQCINYASDKESRAESIDIKTRIDRGRALWESLEEWKTHFARYDHRLPTDPGADFPFQPIWVNPSAASK